MDVRQSSEVQRRLSTSVEPLSPREILEHDLGLTDAKNNYILSQLEVLDIELRKDPSFQVSIAGEMGIGKSTLIEALLGIQSLLPSSTTKSATTRVVEFCYGEE